MYLITFLSQLQKRKKQIIKQDRMDSIFHYCLSVLSVEQSQVLNVSNSFYSLEQRHQTNIFHIRFCFVKKIEVSLQFKQNQAEVLLLSLLRTVSRYCAIGRCLGRRLSNRCPTHTYRIRSALALHDSHSKINIISSLEWS